MSDQVRVSLGDVENHLDNVRGTQGNINTANDGAVRKVGEFNSQTNGGIGSDDLSRQHAATRHHADDVNHHVTNSSGRIGGHANDMIGGVKAAASKNLGTIS